jgi:DNA polymerase III epsilon subunit-like protein
MNRNKICVFDFETDGTNPQTLNPVQLAAVIVDPRKLEVIPNATFNSFIRPEDFDDPKYFEKHRNTIEWHAGIRNCSVDEVTNLWRNSPSQKSVWNDFIEFLDKYHCHGKRKSKFSAPIAAGYNILNFDMPVIKRMAKAHSNSKEIFHPRDKIDLMHWMFQWFENNEKVTSYSMDNMRDFFGMSKAGAHDALQDVIDTANLMCRFMRLHRITAKKVKFEGAFGV